MNSYRPNQDALKIAEIHARTGLNYAECRKLMKQIEGIEITDTYRTINLNGREAISQHKLVRIYKNGRCYAATYAEPFPTKESALADYKSNPKSFEPYNETTGEYCGEAR